jgi:hypothetical protein
MLGKGKKSESVIKLLLSRALIFSAALQLLQPETATLEQWNFCGTSGRSGTCKISGNTQWLC